MLRIVVSVIENISNTNGTTVRARSVVRILKDKSRILIVTRANSIDDALVATMGITSSSIRLIKPERTKLWNAKLMPIILSNRFNVVYCVADLFGFLTYYLLSKFLKYKIVFEAHALAYREKAQFSKLKSAIFYLLEVFIGCKADAIIALSGVAYSFYKRFNKNTFLIHIFPTVKQFGDFRKGNKNTLEKTIGLIGPFDILSNRHQLDFIYANLDRFDKRIRFKIIGKCNKRLIDDRIEYTDYIESAENYLEAISALDALLVPAKIATYGPKNKIVEAMSCGVPVFATWEAVKGMDFVQNFKNIIVTSEDQLVDVVNEFVFNEEYMNEISLNARDTIRKNYDEELHTRKILDILLRTLAQK